MIFGIATDNDFKAVVNPNQENYKYKPYYHKVTSTLYTNKKYIIEKNPRLTKKTKEEIIRIFGDSGLLVRTIFL